MPYDTVKDLQPVTLMHVMANVLVVNSQTSFQSVADLVAVAKAKPGTLNFGSPGNGNTMHLAAELMKARTGTDMVHVPYKNGPNALADVVAGHLPFMFNNLPAVVDLVKASWSQRSVNRLSRSGSRCARLRVSEKSSSR